MDDLLIPDDVWQVSGEMDRGELTATIHVNGVPMVAHALPVRTDANGFQVGADMHAERSLSGLAGELDVTGFRTTEILGRPFVVYIVPRSL